jgi:pimeloyl-ACP methyl ester carboxylesterase
MTASISTRPLPDVPGVTHRQVDVDGLSVHVAEAGSGEPLVLLHGWPQHWYCWRSVIPLLADRYRLVMPDLRGHGWTDAPGTGYDKEQLATDLLGLLDALDLPQVGLVGHDWGGWTGFLACLRAPERFRGFLALGIVHPFQRPSLSKALQGWRIGYQVPLSTPVLAELGMQLAPQLLESLISAGSTRREVFTPEDLRTYSAAFQEPARARATVQLYRTFLTRESLQVGAGRYRGQRLTVPTRMVNGAGDLISSPALLAGFEANADDMTAEVVERCGHFVPEEVPELVAARARTLFG